MQTRTLIETFQVAKENGDRRTVKVYQIIHTTPRGERVPGLKDAFDDRDNPMNTGDFIEFRDVVTGEVFRKL